MNAKKIDAALEQIDLIDRASRQPRLSDPKLNLEHYFDIFFQLIKESEIREPPYVPDSRLRDRWLRAFMLKEPLLNSVAQTAISIDKNRGWKLEGPERQIRKYTNILHGVEGGWRQFMQLVSSSYYSTDIGYIIELERSFKPSVGGPVPSLINMYNVDPTKCRLRQKGALTYYPPNSAKQEWVALEYLRSASQINLDEGYNRLGYCAISRCVDIAKLLIAVFEHDMEKLLAKAPRGLLLLKNISEAQWKVAMTASGEQMNDFERRFYNLVAVIATEGPEAVSAEMVTLSNIPEGFTREQVINTSMYAYALAFGYDPREFWPVSGGQLGTAMETDVQHRKATGKGAVNLILDMQEQVQRNFPPSIEFVFEQRDVEGEQADVALAQAKIDVIKSMAGIMTTIKSSRIEDTIQRPIERAENDPEEIPPDGETKDKDPEEIPPDGETKDKDPEKKEKFTPEEVAEKQKPTPGVVMTSGTETVLSREEVRILLAEAGLIPSDWTLNEETAQVSDTSDNPELEELRAKYSIQRAARLFPNEPILRYSWPKRTTQVLFERGTDVFTRKYF